MSTSFSPSLAWKIINLETNAFIDSGRIPNPVERNQPPESELTESFGSKWAELSSTGMEKPVQQWVGNNQETASVDLLFFAPDITADIEDRVRLLKAWAVLDKNLNPPRVPLLKFIYGKYQLEMKLGPVGNLRWGQQLRWPDGSAYVARCSVVMRKWTRDLTYKTTDPNKPELSTVFHVVAEGETYEHIAVKRYGIGNAKYGVILRQQNPDKNILRIGDTIEVPDLDKIQRLTIEPTSPIFKNSAAANAVRNQIWNNNIGISEVTSNAVAVLGFDALTMQVEVI